MSDLIDRQAAIDAIEELIKARLYWIGDLLSREERKGLDAALCAIVDLPSAQPEIIRCKDCRWKEGSECTRFSDVRPFPDDFCSRAERKTDE